MGNIKTAQIKNFSEKLVKMFPHKFSDDFETNKKVLDELVKITSKTLRNKIAGYVTKLMESKK
ncbi:MAG: 30S ribosomal protein S17e [Candidatus Aenigmatarchaeota archaeon]